MILYAIIMFAIAGVFSVVSVQIYKGQINLIHDYHRHNVTDKAGYGKAFGKAMSVIAVTMSLSAVMSLFGERVMYGAVAVLVAGLIIGIVAIVRVQKQYNDGVFSDCK